LMTAAKDLAAGQEPAEPWKPEGYRLVGGQQPRVEAPIATTPSS
jgi:hypothetical protein